MIFIISCKKKQLFYHGIVVDKYNNPIGNVIVKEAIFTKQKQFTITRKNGEFRLYRNPNFIAPLIFSKEKYITDTIENIFFEYNERENYNFSNKEIDTIILKKTE